MVGLVGWEKPHSVVFRGMKIVGVLVLVLRVIGDGWRQMYSFELFGRFRWIFGNILGSDRLFVNFVIIPLFLVSGGRTPFVNFNSLINIFL